MAVPWNDDDYCASLSSRQRGLKLDAEDHLLTIFPPLCPVEDILANQFPILLDPAIITDDAGHILMWYLPGLLSPARQVSNRLLSCIAC